MTHRVLGRLSAAATVAAVGTGAIGISLVAAPVASAKAPPQAAAVVTVPAPDPSLLYLGRWGRTGDAAWTVNSGSRVILRFTGSHLVGLFSQQQVTYPPQAYVSVDGSPTRRISVDRNRIDLAPAKLRGGTHTLELAVKDVDERANRWTPPLQSGLGVRGFELGSGARVLPSRAPTGPKVEFLGDSITQGVRAVGPQIGVTGSDAVRDYAWLSGTALGGNFIQVGFGAQGITRPGGGGVPAAPATLGLNYAGSPVDPDAVPAAVVVNQGTNDALNGVSSADFAPAYTAYLREIRSRWPHAWIFALRPFGGYFAPEIAAAVHSVADPRVIYVDTTGWVPPTQLTDDLHPTVVGHRSVARRLTRIVARTTGWTAAPIPSGQAPLAAAGARPGFEGSRAAAWRRGSHVRTVAANTAGDPYQGRRALQVTSTSAPLGEWRTVKLRAGQRVPLPRRAKNVYAYVSVPGSDVQAFDVRVRALRNGRVHTATAYDIPNLAGFLPWSRVSVDVPGRGALTALSISVRAEGSSTSGRLDYAVDDIGWTDVRTGNPSLALPRGVA